MIELKKLTLEYKKLKYEKKIKPKYCIYIDKTKKWTDIAIKRILIEFVRGDYELLMFSDGTVQKLRYVHDDLNYYYDIVITSRLKKMLNNIENLVYDESVLMVKKLSSNSDIILKLQLRKKPMNPYWKTSKDIVNK